MRVVGGVAVLVGLAMAGGAPGAAAGDAPPPAGPGPEAVLFEAVPSVYGASRYDQKASEAPAWVTVITADEIQLFGARTLGDILRSVPGFYVDDDRNYSYAGVRGFLRPGDYNTRILLLVDGHRTNDNVYDSALIGSESPVPVALVDRVEVIRGPSSSLYGTNAFFAVVNVVTRSGRDYNGGEVSAEAGSYGTGRGRIAYGDQSPRGFEYLASVAGYRSDGQTLFYPEYDSPATHDGVADGVDQDRYTSAFVKASVGRFTLEGISHDRVKHIPTGSFQTIFDDPATRTSDTRLFGVVSYAADPAPRVHVDSSVSFDDYRYDGRYAYATGLFLDYGHGRWWTAESRVTAGVGERQRLVGGVEARDNARQDQGAYDPTGVSLRDRRTSDIWAAYAEDEIRAGAHLLLNLGLRYDRYYSFGGTANPRLAAIVPVGPRTTFKALYGRAFRAPNSYELYYQSAGTQKGNGRLDPETMRMLEVDWEQEYTGALRSVVAVYDYRIADLISQQVDPSDGLLVFGNVAGVEARGADLSLQGRLGPRLDGRLSWSLMDAEDGTTHERLVNSPSQMAKLNLSSPLLGERLRAGLEVQAMGGRLTRTGARADGFTLTDLVFMGRGFRRAPGLTLSGGVYNLFDTRYADPVGSEFVQETIRQDGRSVRLQVRYGF